MIHVEQGLTDIQVVPTALVDSEWKFIKDLTIYLEENERIFEGKELYLIRNFSRKGIGFFEESGFYPDFIMWYFNGSQEYIIWFCCKVLNLLSNKVE